jgi:Alkaline phosphatase PhoX
VIRRKQAISLVVGGAVAIGAVFVAVGLAKPSSSLNLTNVPTANTKSDGFAPPSKLSPELSQVAVAQGATKLENTSALTSYYGYDNDNLNAAGEPVMVPTATNPTEAHKTEPDKNTYLTFKHSLTGADPNYDYGTHFLFQGHEAGANGAGYITRINLDADAAHRVTLLATQDAGGAQIATIDGSTWDPWAQRLLLTTENPSAPTYAATPGYPSNVTDVSGALGRGGYEGIQDDSAGNLWIVEDIGGANKAGATASRRPNSFVYRYVPQHPGDLANGKLQVLQVLNESSQPITFESQAAFNAPDEVALHTYGKTFQTRWVTIHDTATDGTAPFNANTLAKTPLATHAGNVGTPFKRPENGVFRPGSDFKQFYFDETGDTNATSSENNSAGGWGSILKLTQTNPSANSGTLSLFYKADGPHSSFDNVTFLSKGVITFVQDAGDGLHTSLNALDSGFTFDVTKDYSNSANQPIRWIAEGRDPSATLDGSASPTGFGKNDGSNELTGVYVSDGDPSVGGILGAKVPDLSDSEWRWFYTQQHGDNTTWEVLPHRHHH